MRGEIGNREKGRQIHRETQRERERDRERNRERGGAERGGAERETHTERDRQRERHRERETERESKRELEGKRKIDRVCSPLWKGSDIPKRVSNDLYLNVVRVLNELLNEHRIIPKGTQCFCFT
jgi:hypothetical protein